MSPFEEAMAEIASDAREEAERESKLSRLARWLLRKSGAKFTERTVNRADPTVYNTLEWRGVKLDAFWDTLRVDGRVLIPGRPAYRLVQFLFDCAQANHSEDMARYDDDPMGPPSRYE